MEISDLQNVTMKQLDKLDDKQLKQIIKTVGGSLNKRYRNIKSSPLTNKAAVRGMDKTGGKFSSKNKHGDQLRAEIMRMKNFASKKTSTVAGAKKSMQKISKHVTGTTGQEVAKEKAQNYRKNEKKRILEKSGQKQLTKAQTKKIKKESEKIRKRVERQFLSDISSQFNDYQNASDYDPEGLGWGKQWFYPKQDNDTTSGTFMMRTTKAEQDEFNKRMKQMQDDALNYMSQRWSKPYV